MEQTDMSEIIQWRKENDKSWREAAEHFKIGYKAIQARYHYYMKKNGLKKAKRKPYILRKAAKTSLPPAAPRFVDIPLVTQDESDITVIRCKVSQIASVLGGF